MLREIIHDLKSIRMACLYADELSEHMEKEEIVTVLKCTCDRMKRITEKLETILCQDYNNL